MRRILALLLAVPLAALAGAVTAPAHAGDTTYVVVRALESSLDRFDRSSFDCAGEPAGGQPGLTLKVSPIHVHGQGSLLVRGAPDYQSGLMLRSPAKPRTIDWPVYPLTGEAPQARWRVEMNDDVLTSDPIPLERDTWNALHVDEATLSDGAGWTGTIEDYIAEFGKGDSWRVGLLTGGCLDSREVRIDAIGARQVTYDFEPRNWVVLTATTTDGRDGTLVDYGDRFRLTARANHYDLGSDSSHRVDGTRLVFQRRWAGSPRWRTVTSRTTDERGVATVSGTADRAAYWRVVWRRSDTTIPSDPAYQGSKVVLSKPSANGERCRIEGPGYPRTCRPIRVDRGRVVLSGTARPGGSAIIDVEAGDSTREVRVDRRGHWRATFPTDDTDRLTVEVRVRSASPKHFASGGWVLPLRVR